MLCLIQTVSAAWVKQRIMSFAWFYDVTFVDSKRGFIVGSGGTVYETADGGSTWTKRQNFTQDTLKQISFSDASNGWVLCQRDVFNRGAMGSSYMMRTTDGGSTWNRYEFSGGRERVTSFFFNPKGAGYAVGEKGAIFEYKPDSDTWDRRPTAFSYILMGGAFSGDQTATLVGTGGNVFYSEDSGASWINANFQTKPTGAMTSVFFVNRSYGWVAGAGGAIYQTLNGGRSWRQQTTGVKSDLTNVRFATSAEGYAVGENGTILYSKTAGNVWIAEDSGVKHRLERVAVNGSTAVAVGFGGTILVRK